MPFTLDTFARLRPVLYHVTRPENRPAIAADGWLRPAAELAGPDAPPRLLPRPDAVPVTFAGRPVLLNDQKPLNPKYLDLDPGWDLPRWLAHLDQRVFFWPGTAAGPVAAGRNHLACYAKLGGVVLALPTAELFARNPGVPVEFARVNTGAPSPRNRPNRRGGDTFRPCDRFAGTAADVVEVTLAGPVALPGRPAAG